MACTVEDLVLQNGYSKSSHETLGLVTYELLKAAWRAIESPCKPGQTKTPDLPP